MTEKGPLFPRKHHNVAVRVNDELFAAITKYGILKGVSRGELIRQAVQQFIWANPIEQFRSPAPPNQN